MTEFKNHLLFHADWWEDASAWEGHYRQATTWQEVVAAINELDGVTRTLVCFENQSDLFLMVGGGSAGVTVVWTYEDQGSGILRGDDVTGFSDLVVGQQSGPYKNSNIVDRGRALDVIHDYACGKDIKTLYAWDTNY